MLSKKGDALLQAGMEFLCNFQALTGEASVRIDPAEIEPLRRLHEETGFYRVDVPRAAMIGEFKAGKSTLINALLERSIAPADFFEMTSWIARYWPADVGFCRLNRSNGTTEVVELTEFLARCNSRTISDSELRMIESVDVGVADVAMSYSLIDCPGLGSTNRENEQRMLRALQDSDVAVLCLDSTQIGSTKESVLVNRLIETGMPLLVVLTKCDELDAGERTEVEEYVRSSYALSDTDVMQSCAKEYIDSGYSDGFVAQSGIARLKAFLNAAGARNTEIRGRAMASHEREVATLTVYLLDRVAQDLSSVDDAVAKFARIAGQISNGVQSQVEQEIEDYIRRSLFEGYRDCLEADLNARLGSAGGALSDKAVREVFQQRLGDTYFDQFWARVSTQVSTSAAGIWSSKVAEHASEIQGVVAELSSVVHLDMTALYSATSVQDQAALAGADAFRTAAVTTVGIAAAATAYAAWLSPVAASLTLGVAATGIGLPIAAVGAAVTAGVVAWRTHSTRSRMAHEAAFILDRIAEDLIENQVRKSVHPSIRRLNDQIVSQLVTQFQSSILGCELADRPDELAKQARQLSESIARSYPLARA